MLMKYDRTYIQLAVEKPAEIGFLLKVIMVMKETFWLKINLITYITAVSQQTPRLQATIVMKLSSTTNPAS